MIEHLEKIFGFIDKIHDLSEEINSYVMEEENSYLSDQKILANNHLYDALSMLEVARLDITKARRCFMSDEMLRHGKEMFAPVKE